MSSSTSCPGAFRPWHGVIFAAAMFACGGTIEAAEVNKPAPKAEAPPVAAPAAPEVTDSDLQNLVACARMKLPDLTPEQIAAVAIAIKHAEDDIAAMRKAKAVPVEIKDEKK